MADFSTTATKEQNVNFATKKITYVQVRLSIYIWWWNSNIRHCG